MIELPERFGRYTILARLGRGGMGSVYLTEDTVLGRKVALKVAHLGDDGDNTKIVERFRREARAAAGLSHANLCHVYDFGEHDGVHFLTMEYIEGDSLDDLIRWRRGITPRTAVEIVRTLALALAEAHAHGVIHRDLKPSNVMMRAVGSRREPVIVDFGLARRDDPNERRLTRTGQYLGTPHYMPPEQVRGDLQAMGPACDVYALGVILYELLTGRPPFDGPNAAAIMAQVLSQDPPSPSALVANLDPRLEILCLSAMARDARARPGSMTEFAATLDTIVAPAPTPTPGSLSPSDSGAVGRPAPANHTTISDPPGRAPDVVPTRAVRRDEPPPKEITSPTTGLVLVRIEPGEFDIGSGDDDTDAEGDEKPRHRVRITGPFFLGKFQVTRGQFRKFVEDTGYKTEGEKDGTGAYGWNAEKGSWVKDAKYSWRNSGFEQTDEHPVVCVSWNDAVACCAWLSQKDGATYRLPTEAEWEYACRAGSTTRYSFGDDPEGLALVGHVADGTAKEKFPSWTTIQARDGYVFTAPVGRFRPNAFGLCDMHGNVWEWCSDRFDTDYYKWSPTDDPQGPLDETAPDRVGRGLVQLPPRLPVGVPVWGRAGGPERRPGLSRGPSSGRRLSRACNHERE